MVEQLSSSSLPSTGELLKTSVMDDLFELASIRNLDLMLHKTIGMAVRLFGAEAGSLLFYTQITKPVRSGPFRPEVLARIERWEEAIGKRLAGSAWKIPASVNFPISTARVTAAQLVLVNIPLLQDRTVVGSLSLILPAGKNLDSSQRNLLGRVARGVGEMASLIIDVETAQQRLKQMGIFYQVGQALVTTFDIKKLLSDTMQLAANMIDAGAASIMLIDDQKQELVFEITHGSRSKVLRRQRIPLDEGIGGWVARNGQPIIANEARTDPRFSHRVDVRTGFLTQSIAAVPIKIKGRIIGVLEVLNKYSGAGFDQEDIGLMSSIAAQVAIAIENARLYQQVRQERDRIIKAQENVRRELERDLHDGPVQLLSAISMSLDHLERLSAVKPEAVRNEITALRNLVHQAAHDTRQVLFELRPVILETQGLVAALGQYVEQLRLVESFTIHFNSVKQISCDTRVAGTIFSIVQEAFNNIRQHAGAHNVWLSLGVKDNRLFVNVRDDGVGFDLKQTLAETESRVALGLSSMRDRAELIEAELKIESRVDPPTQGTVIQLIVPLLPAETLDEL